ncbi:MAG: hypothetical protein UW11_C0019G0017 [Parcubacteria group bacterium GW2011_GWA2_43_9b]|nr:MAG: hypothetical protein UW11_C0019G0017 [Parcubacteria group bacterium GW2011_GWA2_43_9b]
MSTSQLNKFLVKAKISTYASSGESEEKLFPDGSKEFEFRKKELKYRDRYFGFNPFLGQEVVFQKGKIVWGMNYYSEIISKIIPPKQVYQFLQRALKKIPDGKPFRGPRRFKKDNFQYFNEVKGVVEKFEGEEKIFYKRKLIYRLIYHGGVVMEFFS